MAAGDQSASSLQHSLHLPVPDAIAPRMTETVAHTRPGSEDILENRLRREATHEAGKWKLSPTRRRLRDFEAKWHAIAQSIEKTRTHLRRFRPVDPASAAEAEWFRENSRLLKAAVLETREALKSARRFPQIELGALRLVPRAYAAAAGFLRAADYAFDEDSFASYVSAAQTQSPLQMAEVWALKPMMEFVLLEHIARAAETCGAGPKREAQKSESGGDDNGRVPLSKLISSLAQISEAEWNELFERLSDTERVLRDDPSGAYPKMDFESRDLYRSAVSKLAAHSKWDEVRIAREAIALARAAQHTPSATQRITERRGHVGYYLVEKGNGLLRRRIAFRPSVFLRIQEAIRRWPHFYYLAGIGLTTFVILALLLSRLRVSAPTIAALSFLLLPAAESAVGLMNHLTAFLVPPRRLPKLDFSEGILPECTTMVVVPTLLMSEEQVRRLVSELEIRYLGNRDANLYFALLTDSPDSTKSFDDRDKLVGLCSALIQNLNQKYASRGKAPFFLFHRHPVYNPSEGTWMGWERKRGKLLDFNDLLRNNYDGFPVKLGDLSVLSRVKYVITLDSDTQLPMGTAHKLIGALEHPLNRAVIDPRTNTVTEGYGILQPRVGVSVQSAGRSRLAALLSGDTGFDIYTRAVSDVYQDLFGEGSFVGKGIYEVDTFQQVLNRRFPCNALLSHDLIEGAHARAGLVSDVEVIDDYPSHFSAYSRRKHRWVRGDWQTILWLLPRVPNYSRRLVPNPLSLVSRWKILDNLRRSLTDIAVFLLLLAGWFFLPGGPIYWTLATLAIISSPSCVQLVLAVLRAGRTRYSASFWKGALSEFAHSLLNAFVKLALLCHQALVILDAVIRTVVRMTLTHKKLLEWETAAQAELTVNRRSPVEIYLSWSASLSLAIAVLLAACRPNSLSVAWPFLVVWCFPKLFCEWLNRPLRAAKDEVSLADATFLRDTALRTWRFFRQFSNAETNWLIPDTVQEIPPKATQRISPTNLGLLFNSRLAAYDLGYLTLPEFVRETERTLDTVQHMEKFKGHLYNWYDTQTLRPLEPLFVSTVDSGNLACCLWTLKNGCVQMLQEPLLRSVQWQAIYDHVRLIDNLLCKDPVNQKVVSTIKELRRKAQSLRDDSVAWLRALPGVEHDVLELKNDLADSNDEIRWWVSELSARIDNLQSMVRDFAPWLSPPYLRLCEAPEVGARIGQLTLESAPAFLKEFDRTLRDLADGEATDPESRCNLDSLRALLSKSERSSADVVERLTALAAKTHALVDAMDLGFLLNSRRKLLSIGYDTSTRRLNTNHYNLLASEARSAAFVAIAKGDIPQESWLHLGRAHTLYMGKRILYSWSGTMFEYLLPSLWMKCYPNTILEQNARACVRSQQKFARSIGAPWGISEAACSRRNHEGDYCYQAFGVPGLALNPKLSGELLIAPYASFLSLGIAARGAIENLRRMEQRSWLGAYGFYEAADFTASRISQGMDCEVVRCWMAHHQGMSLLAVSNLLADGPMQRRFHAEPLVAATERLLHEKVPMTVPVEREDERERERAAQPSAEQASSPPHSFWPSESIASLQIVQARPVESANILN
jgi:cyclic beta-1,2-glucan synthetase